MNRLLRSMTAAGALTAALLLGACAQTQTSDSTGNYVDDSAITAKVKSAILQDPTLRVMQITVNTQRNVVQLSGFVDTPQMVRQAGTVATGVAGVASVQNDLLVKK